MQKFFSLLVNLETKAWIKIAAFFCFRVLRDLWLMLFLGFSHKKIPI